jgi:hypothetical protein
MAQPNRPPGRSPASPPRRGLARFRELPKWTQGWIAALGLVIAALGLGLTALQVFRVKEPAPTPIVIKPEAYIEEVTVSNGEIAALGAFRNVDIAAEVVLFVGRPTGVADARWLPVEAVVHPQASATGPRVDGQWSALRPFVEQGPFTWRALVVPAGSGATDGYEDIKANGPNSEDVLATSAEFRTGE